jgi:hypothetical protein
MSIIRSNIARQLLAEGGAPRKPFARGGRDDAESQYGSGSVDSYSYSEPTSVSGPDQEDDNARMMSDMGLTPSFGPDRDDDDKALSYINFNRPQQTPSFFQKSFDTLSTYSPLGLFTKFDERFLKPSRDKYNLSRRTDFLRKEGVIGPGEEDEKYTDDFLLSPEGLDMLRGMGYTTIQDVINKGESGDNEPIKKLRAPITEKKEEPKDEFDDILQFYGARFAGGGRTDAESQYGADSAGSYSYSDDGNRDDGGGPPTAMGGGSQQLQKPSFPTMAAEKPGIMDKISNFFTFNEEEDEPKTAADFQTDALKIGRAISDKASPYGGALTTVSGGQKTDVPGMTKADAIQAAFDAIPKADGGSIRQAYGLGSIVKKAVGAVKKVAKSPIGKAALFAGLGAYGLGAGPFSSGKFGAGFLKSEGFKKFLLKDAAKGFKLNNISSLALLGVPTAASFLMAKKDEEEEELPTVSNTDPEFQKYLAFYGGPRRFAQTGGDIDEAPMEDVPKQEMASYGYNDAMSDTYDMFLQMKEKQLIPPGMDFQEFLQEVVPEMSKRQGIKRAQAAGGGMMNPNDEMLNLGGNEMDLRGGGFVPLGEYEKKDDVPARLSKNEFVFTADAVKAAGGGSVDRGADIMYKTMKNLENKIA